MTFPKHRICPAAAWAGVNEIAFLQTGQVAEKELFCGLKLSFIRSGSWDSVSLYQRPEGIVGFYVDSDSWSRGMMSAMAIFQQLRGSTYCEGSRSENLDQSGDSIPISEFFILPPALPTPQA